MLISTAIMQQLSVAEYSHMLLALQVTRPSSTWSHVHLIAQPCLLANVSVLHRLSLHTPLAGDETIKHLVSRGAHRRFSYQSLMVMLAWYFLGAAVAAGSAISSGLFVPMLM
jgi:hypothetical protein